MKTICIVEVFQRESRGSHDWTVLHSASSLRGKIDKIIIITHKSIQINTLICLRSSSYLISGSHVSAVGCCRAPPCEECWRWTRRSGAVNPRRCLRCGRSGKLRSRSSCWICLKEVRRSRRPPSGSAGCTHCRHRCCEPPAEATRDSELISQHLLWTH